MYQSGRQTLIAREGWPLIILLLSLTLAAYKLVGPWTAVLSGLLTLLIGYLYRDPYRPIPPLPLAVLSPVDGIVLYAEQGQDPYLDRPAHHIRMRIRRTGIFGLRSPLEGKVNDQWFLRSADNGSGTQGQAQAENGRARHSALWVQTDEGDKVVFVLETPYHWQRPTCYVRVGERLGQGQRCGRMPFGGYVDLFIPAAATLAVTHGDSVTAGVTVVATLNHDENR